MSDDTTYNGWSNRETWLASLWLTNDEPSYRLLLRAMKAGRTDIVCSEWLAERVHEQLNWYLGSQEASIWSDMLCTAFDRVDWVEVIENNRD
jgi:hypothetical protein